MRHSLAFLAAVTAANWFLFLANGIQVLAWAYLRRTYATKNDTKREAKLASVVWPLVQSAPWPIRVCVRGLPSLPESRARPWPRPRPFVAAQSNVDGGIIDYRNLSEEIFKTNFLRKRCQTRCDRRTTVDALNSRERKPIKSCYENR